MANTATASTSAETDATTTFPMVVGCSHVGVGLGELSAPAGWINNPRSFPVVPSSG